MVVGIQVVGRAGESPDSSSGDLCCQIPGNGLILPPLSELTLVVRFHLTTWTSYFQMALTQETFDRLLTWLHPDREEAGRIYENIRANLIAKFRSHHRPFTDKLADETIDRVATKLGQIIETYVGEREPYFRRVGYYVLMEDLAKEHPTEELGAGLALPATAPAEEDSEPEFACLDGCMKNLSLQKREIIEKYYRADKGTKIRLRKELALSLSLELPALRVHAHRIRADLKKCIQNCLRAGRVTSNDLS